MDIHLQTQFLDFDFLQHKPIDFEDVIQPQGLAWIPVPFALAATMLTARGELLNGRSVSVLLARTYTPTMQHVISIKASPSNSPNTPFNLYSNQFPCMKSILSIIHP